MALSTRFMAPSWGSPPRSSVTRGAPVRPGAGVAVPSRPPAGTYDPGLDAQQRAANRGYQDVQIDTETANQRANTQYTQDRGSAQRDRGYGLEDFGLSRDSENRGYGRSLADILTARARGGEDYQRSTADLTRSYNRQGSAQGEQAAARGVSSGGTLAAALAARTENQAHDQAPIDTSYQRFSQDSARSEGRLGEDHALALQGIDRAQNRFTAGYDDPTLGLLAKIDQGYAYGVDDRSLQLARAGRENTFYGQDVADQRAYQAAQMGWTPPETAAPAAQPAASGLRMFRPSWYYGARGWGR